MSATHQPFILTQLRYIADHGLTDDDFYHLNAEEARQLASRLDHWATRLFNHANRQPLTKPES
ncbi:MAG: hypothetical protein EOM92_18180 [Gammaproteobacteria bacterium]|nr:hypothetical protein [Gammaproteobacteria bacterium]